jgi:hypothetical protein
VAIDNELILPVNQIDDFSACLVAENKTIEEIIKAVSAYSKGENNNAKH